MACVPAVVVKVTLKFRGVPFAPPSPIGPADGAHCTVASEVPQVIAILPLNPPEDVSIALKVPPLPGKTVIRGFATASV